MKTMFPRQRKDGGQVVLGAVIFLVVGTLAILVGFSRPLLSDTIAARGGGHSKQSYALAEALVEDIAYRLMKGIEVSSSETLTEGESSVSASVEEESGTKQIVATGDVRNLFRSVTVTLVSGKEVTLPYALQAAEGGIRLENNALIGGNVYSSGAIYGDDDNVTYGDVISAGPSGLIDGVHATGSAYAHTIDDSTIGRDAYYVSISDTTVGGTSYPGSSDQPTTGLPVTDETIADLEASALAGGVINSPCPYVVNASQTLGPVKITCDLQIRGGTITLLGNVWVVGDITISQIPSPTVRIDPSLVGQSIAVIADEPGDNSSGAKISLQNNTTFSAPIGSYISFISANTSASEGGGVAAVKAVNNAQGVGGTVAPVFLYAPRGLVQILNNAMVTGAAGYRILARNNAVATYQSDLESIVFPSASGFSISGWEETE